MSSYASQVPVAGPLGDRGLRPRPPVLAERPRRRARRRGPRRAREGRRRARRARPGGPADEPARLAPYPAPASVERIGRIGLVAGVAGVVLRRRRLRLDRATSSSARTSPDTCGCSASPRAPSALLLLHHLTRGAWGVMIRRILEAAASPRDARLRRRRVPPRRPRHPTRSTSGPTPTSSRPTRSSPTRARWLNEPSFLVRSAVYFALWLLLASVLGRLSRAAGRDGRPRARPLRCSAGAPCGLVVYFVSMTFASFDWIDVAHAALVLHDLRPLRRHRPGGRRRWRSSAS